MTMTLEDPVPGVPGDCRVRLIKAASRVAEMGVVGEPSRVHCIARPRQGHARCRMRVLKWPPGGEPDQTAPTSRSRASRWRAPLLLPFAGYYSKQRKGFSWECPLDKSSLPALASAVASLTVPLSTSPVHGVISIQLSQHAITVQKELPRGSCGAWVGWLVLAALLHCLAGGRKGDCESEFGNDSRAPRLLPDLNLHNMGSAARAARATTRLWLPTYLAR